MYYDDITQELLYIICLCLSLRQIWCNHTPLPVVTKYLLLLLTAIHIYRSNVSDKKYNFYFCSRSFDLYQWYTPLTSALAHADAIHLGMNGLSTYRLLPQLERIWGTNRTIAMILVITSLEHFLYYLLQTQHTCVIGFSGVVFGLMQCHSLYFPDQRFIMNGFEISSRQKPWFSLVAASMAIPEASFLGHLCGILSIYILDYFELLPGLKKPVSTNQMRRQRIHTIFDS